MVYTIEEHQMVLLMTNETKPRRTEVFVINKLTDDLLSSLADISDQTGNKTGDYHRVSAVFDCRGNRLFSSSDVALDAPLEDLVDVPSCNHKLSEDDLFDEKVDLCPSCLEQKRAAIKMTDAFANIYNHISPGNLVCDCLRLR